MQTAFFSREPGSRQQIDLNLFGTWGQTAIAHAYFIENKRLEAGKFQWPRTESEVRSITSQQFRWLMEGLTTLPKKQVKRLKKAPDYTV